MSIESRWFRLNVGWWETDWVNVLSAEAQLAWIKFLGRVKTNGYGGTLPKVSTALLARQWMQGEESIMQMLKAAKIEGAIVETDDSWMVPKWKIYQGDPTHADRQRRYKQRKMTSDDGGDASATEMTVNIDNDIDNDNDIDINGKFRKPSLEEVCEYMKSRNWKDPQGQSHQFVDYNASRGWMVGKSSMKDWKAAVRTWEFKNPNLIKPNRNDDDDDRVARL